MAVWFFQYPLVDNTTVWSNWTSSLQGEVSETQTGPCRPTSRGWKQRGRFLSRFSWRKDAESRLHIFRMAPRVWSWCSDADSWGSLSLIPPPRLGLPSPSLLSPFSLLLCSPWEMLADLPPQQMKQAAAPQGRCRGQAMQGLIFFMSTVEERGLWKDGGRSDSGMR